jgi:hypothetical protein
MVAQRQLSIMVNLSQNSLDSLRDYNLVSPCSTSKVLHIPFATASIAERGFAWDHSAPLDWA